MPTFLEPITLPSDPSSGLQASTKQYVDAKVLTNGILYSNSQLIAVVNTTTETTLASFTIPGNTLNTNNSVECRLTGTYKNASNNSATITLSIKYGSTTLYKSVSGSLANNTNLHAVDLDFRLSSANATNAQVLGGYMAMGAANAPTSGISAMNVSTTATTGINNAFGGNSAIDSTTSQTLAITLIHSVANSNIEFDVLHCDAYIVGTGATGANGTPGITNTDIKFNVQTGTSYTFTNTDSGSIVAFTNTSPVTATVPASTFYANAAPIGILQLGSGQVTIANAAGVSITSTSTLKTYGQGAMCGLLCVTNANTFIYTGDRATS